VVEAAFPSSKVAGFRHARALGSKGPSTGQAGCIDLVLFGPGVIGQLTVTEGLFPSELNAPCPRDWLWQSKHITNFHAREPGRDEGAAELKVGA